MSSSVDGMLAPITRTRRSVDGNLAHGTAMNSSEDGNLAPVTSIRSSVDGNLAHEQRSGRNFGTRYTQQELGGRRFSFLNRYDS